MMKDQLGAEIQSIEYKLTDFNEIVRKVIQGNPVSDDLYDTLNEGLVWLQYLQQLRARKKLLQQNKNLIK